MYYDNEEFEQKIDGYKIPRGGKRSLESDGPFVGPPKTEKDKYAEWKRDGSKQRSPNKGYHTHDKGSRNNSRKSNNDYMTGANTAPLGQNSRSNTQSYKSNDKFDPLGLGGGPKQMTYGEARGKFGKPAVEECLNQFDGKLPDEIISKSTEEQCGLCEVSFKQGAPDGSRVTYSYKMALSHYAGKSHMKKLKVELQAWHEKDPSTNIIPKIKEIQASPVKAGGEEQDQNYCHTCKIPLTSPSVAQSHYTGKPHQKQVQKRVREGTYYVEKEAFPEHVRKRQADGKMAVPVEGFPDSIKKPRTADQIFSDAESREGSGNRFFCMCCKLNFKTDGHFGEHMKSPEHKIAKEKAATNPELTAVSPQVSIDKMLSSLRNKPLVTGFDCGLCQVQCSSQVVLDAHLIGKQHKKKLEMTQAPTGNFRCEICNVQSTDQGGLDMHLAGKKHIKKAAQAGSA